MGLDISLYVERKVGTQWRLIFDEGSDALRSDRRWYKERNSTFFAILGFDSDEYPELQPIAPLKGVPDDLSEELSRYYDKEDDWCSSYLTLTELRAFDWQGLRCDSYAHTGTYAEIAGNFYTKTIPMIEQLAEGDPDAIRVVFFFSR